MSLHISSAILSSFFLFYNLIPSQYCSAIDAITPTQVLTQDQTLTSSGQIFVLGFFSPGNSGKNYVGVWYKDISVPTIVWVANRERPLSALNSSAVLTIGGDGNLMLEDGIQNTVWSTNLSALSNNSRAVLLDDGNFVLKDSTSGEFLWQSFDHPCDTFLPNMKIGINIKTGERLSLTSWQTEDDPSPGKFSGGVAAQMPPQTFIWNGTIPFWRSGQWNGLRFTGVPEMNAVYTNVFNLLQDPEQGTSYFTFNMFNNSLRNMIISSVGSLMIKDWDEEKKKWITLWEGPRSPCDLYGVCGPCGVCNRNKSPICRCLKGFVPKSSDEWRKENWTGGCVRRTELLCEKKNPIDGRKNDGFWKLGGTKLPDLNEYLRGRNYKECETWCLNNCSCMAYAYVIGIGCMIWPDSLMDIQEFTSAGEDLYLRLAYSELGNNKHQVKLIFSLTTVSSIIFFAALVYSLHKWNALKKGKRRKGTQEDLAVTADSLRDAPQESSELPMFSFDEIVAATNNFSLTNKLGKGGFGPVFKGKLQDGQEIAVKRLSSSSGQGIEEFKNEIVLISKLQHRNLVRLLGCCIDGEEKLLIYEYMPNKSLDTFLFAPTKGLQLDWTKRFNIIQGIARGLLYLHRDSCLRIIHRDLKGSNILLDEDMNPKISDFGLARTFKRTQDLANTDRVVGTFGYMSPEYAMGGIFSEKSDVYSFGVLLLEIVSSKKNTSFYYDDQHQSLLGYAWQLWNEGRGLDLIDQVLANAFSPLEVMRCIHVGLLCVQDLAVDRPTMSEVVLMLSSETDRPQPKQLAFSFQSSMYNDPESECSKVCSINQVTVSTTVGRSRQVGNSPLNILETIIKILDDDLQASGWLMSNQLWRLSLLE